MAQVMAFDPDPEMRWDVVSSLGHDVTTFNESGEALDYAQTNKVDIALLGGPEGIDMIPHSEGNITQLQSRCILRCTRYHGGPAGAPARPMFLFVQAHCC